MKNDIADDYSKGKISDKQYENMENEIGTLYEEVYSKKISSSVGSLGRIDDKFLDDSNDEISDAHRKRRISDQQYETLKNEISVSYSELFDKRIDSLSKSLAKDEARRILLNMVTDAYSNGKISELHYNILKEKITEYHKIKSNE